MEKYRPKRPKGQWHPKAEAAQPEQRNKEFSLLEGIASSVSQSLDLREALEKGLDRVLELTGATAGAIYLVEGEELVLSLERGRPGGFLFRRVPRGTTLPFPSVPLEAKGKVQGALGLVMAEGPQGEEYRELLSAIGGQMALAIENAQLQERVKAKELQVRRLLPRVIASQEEERRRLSLDLHDSVAQWVFAAMARLGTCDDLLSRARVSEAQMELAHIRQTLEQSLGELRRIASDLHPPALEKQGFVPGLRQYVHDSAQKEGLACSFQVKGTPLPLPLSVEIALYRVVQEALANVLKHAAASQVSIRLEFLEETISTEICDNGKGFDLGPGDETLSGHMGLRNIKERAEILGGNLRIETGPGAGTRIRLEIPTPEGDRP